VYGGEYVVDDGTGSNKARDAPRGSKWAAKGMAERVIFDSFRLIYFGLTADSLLFYY